MTEHTPWRPADLASDQVGGVGAGPPDGFGGVAAGRPAAGGPTRRRLLWLGAAAGCCGTAAIAWIGWTGLQARAELESARSALPALESAVLSGDGSGPADLAQLTRHAAAADGDTHDPVWSLVAALPVIGSPVATTQGLTRAVDLLAQQPLPALVRTADLLHPSHLLAGGSRLDVAGLAAATPALTDAADRLGQERDAVAALDPSWLGPVADARRQLLSPLVSLANTSRDAAGAARLLPPMLGLNGPRRYFVAFQNPAEARGTGGLLDAFAIVVADRGRVRIDRIGSNTQLPPFTGQVTDVDPAFAARYGPLGATSAWLEANVSPNFPDVARAWEAMWRSATGEQLDGALALDPQALAAVLSATGPVTAPVVGQVDATRIGPLVQHDQYVLAQLAGQRKSLMLGVGAATVSRLLGGGVSARRLLPALSRAAGEGHILVSSRVPGEEAQLVAAGLGGAVDTSARPFAEAVMVNAAGDKLDDWLGSALRYQVTSCTSRHRDVDLSVTLRNNAPASGLPPYMTVRSDAPPYPTVPGQNRTEVQVLVTRGATLLGATLDGAPLLQGAADGVLPTSVPADAATAFLAEAPVVGRPSYWLDLETRPGAAHTMVLRLQEPPSTLPPLLPLQTLVHDPSAVAEMGTCPGEPRGRG